jgi:two-component system response regulator BaeR
MFKEHQVMKQSILIVEDEKRVAELLGEYLKNAGYQADMLHDGLDVIPRVKTEPPDLILLDLMLPGKSGLEIAKELRAFSQIPLIMITARVEEVDRLLGLELGADDYICKPFSFREVVSRVKAVLRRTGHTSGKTPMEPLILDESTWRAVILYKPLELTAIEFQLLKAMAKKPGVIFTRDQLMDHIYTDGRIVSDRTIDSHIRKLRRKIDEMLPGVDIIKSVYGVGYKFEMAELQNVEEEL